MKKYSELFLGLILAGVLLMALGFVLIATPGALGSRDAAPPMMMADRSN